jgi:DNA-binding XRE family transcriptional regulator
MAPEVFKAARLAAGLATQEALAEAMEVDRRTAGRWERGDVPVPGAVKVALRCMARLRELGFPAENGAAD